MFSWNVNYKKFQNQWPRDKFSFTLFPGSENLLALPSQHQFTFQSPWNQSQMAVPPGLCCLRPSQLCQSFQLHPFAWISSSHPSLPQRQISKMALKKSFIRLPETYSKSFSGPKPLLTKKNYRFTCSLSDLTIIRLFGKKKKSFLCWCFGFALLVLVALAFLKLKQNEHFTSWLSP